MEELIFNKAKGLFFNYGVKSISMDDLAKEAGVSKKMLYQVVTDKNDLVMQVVRQLVQCHAKGLEKCSREAQDAVEEVVLQTQMTYNLLLPINHAFFFDVKKFFPKGWELIAEHYQEELLPHIKHNLERGTAEGVCRQDLDYEVAIQIRLQHLQSVLYPGAFTYLQHDLQQLTKRFTRFYLQAVTNSKGNRLIEKYFTETNNNRNEQEQANRQN